MTTQPKISIITITYNSEKTLEDTIKSVSSQNYSNLEYIIVDGGSTDSTMEIVNNYSSVVTKWISEPDDGISDAFNKGIKMATGDIIGIINSDDMLTEGALFRLAEEYEEGLDVFYGNAIVISVDGKPKFISNANPDLSHFLYGFSLLHPATFITKHAYTKYGLYDNNYKCAMDFDLLLRFHKNGAKFKYINHSFAYFRLGGKHQTVSKTTHKEAYDIAIKFGGKKSKAYKIYLKNSLKSFVKPYLSFLNIHGKNTTKI